MSKIWQSRPTSWVFLTSRRTLPKTKHFYSVECFTWVLCQCSSFPLASHWKLGLLIFLRSFLIHYSLPWSSSNMKAVKRLTQGAGGRAHSIRHVKDIRLWGCEREQRQRRGDGGKKRAAKWKGKITKKKEKKGFEFREQKKAKITNLFSSSFITDTQTPHTNARLFRMVL